MCNSVLRPALVENRNEKRRVFAAFLVCRSENVLPAIMHTACYTLVTLRKLLLRAGDIEANPGPSRTDTRSDLCIIHLNARSIKNKVDLIEAEANQFDIITVSETWLSQIDMNTSIQLTNFHPSIRRDRPNDPHGGVAIIICKEYSLLQTASGFTSKWSGSSMGRNKNKPRKSLSWFLLPTTEF